MVEHEVVYSRQADLYEQLIDREDYQENLPRAIEKITLFQGLDVAELGAGTGRLTRLIAPKAASIKAFDLSPHMLFKAAEIVWPQFQNEVSLAAADHLYLPIASSSTDIIIAGWSICYLVSWHPENWRSLLANALSEMRRVLRLHGKIILIETQGTGGETPNPPENLIPYYQVLASDGFKSTWIRTDYRFNSMAEAEEITSFFFGREMISKIKNQARPELPECTGIWWLA
jgi:ubiquinone/menaquinone biosynthesis C-methylase UbiE